MSLKFCIYFQVLKVGVVETRYVSLKFCIYFQVLKVGVVETRFVSLKFCIYFQVLKVGVVETRYVSLKFCRPWVIHAYKNLKGRGVHKDGDEGITPMVGIHVHVLSCQPRVTMTSYFVYNC